MEDYGGKYDGNGERFKEYDSGFSPPLRTTGFEDIGDPKSQHNFHNHENTSSKSRDRERDGGKDKDKERGRGRDWERDRERDRDRDKDRDRHHREMERDGSERRERVRDRSEDQNRHRSRDHDRHRDYDRERDGLHRHRSESRLRGRSHHRSRSRSRSRSKRHRDYDRERDGLHRHRSESRSRGRSHHRSRSRSRSRSKSKRVSGFDMAPPASTLLTVAPLQGSIAGVPAPIPGILPNLLPFQAGQIPLPMMPQAMTQQATRHARRVYVGGLSPTANEQSVANFFSHVMAAIGGNAAGLGDAVVNVYINHEKKFAFVEMRSVEEASNAMALDGIIFEGAPVKVRRPSDYNPSLASQLGPSQPNPNLNLAAVGLTPGSVGGLEGPDRIFVGGLPYYFTDTQVRELLESFGPLRGFDLVKDRETGNSKGYAFCVYQDLSVTDIACAALNGIKMGDKTLTVRRANQGTTQPRPEQESILLQAQQQVALQKLVFQAGSLPTKVVCLTQVVSANELKDDEEYEDIMEDMRGEGGKYGTLVNVVIPRPGPNEEPIPGVGKVFLEYADTEGSMKAKQGLHGRKFGEKFVVATFYPENKFAQGDYEG